MRHIRIGILFVFAAGYSGEALAQKNRFAPKRGQSLVEIPNALLLLVQEPLQNDLALSASQRGRVDAVAVEYGKLASGPADGPAPSSLPPRERLKLRAKARAAEAKLLEQLESILSTTQWNRLSQIELQIRGIDLLADASVAKQLGLSKQQQDDLDGIRNRATTDLIKLKRDLFGKDKDRNRDAKKIYKEKSEKLQSTRSGRMLDVLSGSQKRKLQTMLGRPFDVSSLNLKRLRRDKKPKRRKTPKRPDV